jgi:hypothetical protein
MGEGKKWGKMRENGVRWCSEGRVMENGSGWWCRRAVEVLRCAKECVVAQGRCVERNNNGKIRGMGET